MIEPRFSDVMLLADRGFANHQLIQWLQESSWHYSLRLPCDVIIHGARRHPIELKYLVPSVSEAVLSLLTVIAPSYSSHIGDHNLVRGQGGIHNGLEKID